MKATGIVRKLDELGRITLPMELRRTMGIGEKEPMEIFVDGENIVIRKYNHDDKCHCCNGTGKLVEVRGVHICDDCLKLYNKALSMMEGQA